VYFGKLVFESDEQEFIKSKKISSHPGRDLLRSVLKSKWKIKLKSPAVYKYIISKIIHKIRYISHLSHRLIVFKLLIHSFTFNRQSTTVMYKALCTRHCSYTNVTMQAACKYHDEVDICPPHLFITAKYCDEHVCVCMCLSATISSEPRRCAIFTIFLCMLPMAVVWSSGRVRKSQGKFWVFLSTDNALHRYEFR